MQAHCTRRRRPISSFSSFVNLSRYVSLHLASCFLPASSRFSPLSTLFHGFLFPFIALIAITREGKHDADLSAGLSGDARVIYCDLIAFNSSGATVNHRASRIARVRNACCRYDVITSICEFARMRATIAMPRGCSLTGIFFFSCLMHRLVDSHSIVLEAIIIFRNYASYICILQII